MQIEIKTVKLKEIKLNPNNPRRISTVDMDRLVKSLQDFPEMMEIREVVVDETMTCLGGNMRTLALRKAGAKTATAKVVHGLTPEQKREFTIKDNGSWGDWDLDALANGWTDLPLAEWGITVPDAIDLKTEITSEEEWTASSKTADEAIEAMATKIRKIAGDNPKQMGGSIAVIVNNGRGNACLFLADPNTADIVKELKRLADAGEHSPLETLVRSLL